MYRLVNDDDGHWFIIEADKLNEWHKFIEQVVPSYEWDGDFPDYVVEEVGGHPNTIVFETFSYG